MGNFFVGAIVRACAQLGFGRGDWWKGAATFISVMVAGIAATLGLGRITCGIFGTKVIR